MTCAIVLYLDQPFSDVDAIIGLSKAAEIKMASANPSQAVEVLVIRGFENVPEEARRRLAELKYNVVDASGVLESVRRKYPYANDARIWRNDPFHELCFLRWLVLEEYFGDTPILATDADIVWRIDPEILLEGWKQGGSSLCMTAPCYAFIKGADWYQAYRSGLERVAEHSGYGSEFKKDHFTGLYHDQALIQYLVRHGELENDTANLLGHGFSDIYHFMVNPLQIRPAPGESPLTFERKGQADIIGGKIVPYWHMQQRFTRYLWAARFLPVFLDRKMRVPYEGHVADKPDPAVLLLNSLHFLIRRGDVVLKHHRHAPLIPLTNRAAIYGEFFDGGLAHEVFSNEIWWKPGVWAAAG